MAMFALAACGTAPATPAPVVARAAERPVGSVPRVEQRAPAPKEGLSSQLGGMRFGMDADAFTVSCRGAGGIVSRADEINLTCSAAPAPLRANGTAKVDLAGKIAAKFCGPSATVCELAYVFDADGDEQTAALVDMLVGKYGAPTSVEGHPGHDPMNQCQKSRAVHFARVWRLGNGEARLAFECDLRVTEETHKLTLVYEDENGLRYRAGDHAERRDNF